MRGYTACDLATDPDDAMCSSTGMIQALTRLQERQKIARQIPPTHRLEDKRSPSEDMLEACVGSVIRNGERDQGSRISGTSVGALLAAPVPSWPKVLLPQQYALPSLAMAQVWAMAVTPLSMRKLLLSKL